MRSTSGAMKASPVSSPRCTLQPSHCSAPARSPISRQDSAIINAMEVSPLRAPACAKPSRQAAIVGIAVASLPGARQKFDQASMNFASGRKKR